MILVLRKKKRLMNPSMRAIKRKIKTAIKKDRGREW